MISLSAAARSVITSGTMTYDVKASAWLGDELLAAEVPIVAGTEEADRSLNVPERITLSVPKIDRGIDWTPTDERSPLAANGQTLKITLGVGVGRGVIEWFQRGEYVIFSSQEQDETIEVTAVGLLWLVQEAGFVSPFQPSGTIAATLRALIEPALQADLTDAPTDRSVPTGITWDDRIGSLYHLLDAWPARPRMHELGYLEVVEDVAPTVSVRSFTDQIGGTVISAVGASTRDGAFNVVVATGNAADGTEVRGISYVYGGPWSYFEPVANPLPVPFGYASPLLTTQTQAAAAARTVRDRKMREGVLRRFTVTCGPDPAIQLGDCVDITTDALDGLLCTVEHLTLPYVPGIMAMDVVSLT